MNDYEVTPRKRQKCEVKKIPGQTLDLCRDIAAANSLGVSYGVYMGHKRTWRIRNTMRSSALTCGRGGGEHE